MKSALTILAEWIDEQPQITRKSLKEKIVELENRGKSLKPKSETTRFLKPTVHEIQDYCQERNNTVDAEQFFDFYESKNWMIGKVKMKDFRAAIRNWERMNKTKNEPKLIGRQTQETVKNNLNFTPIQL